MESTDIGNFQILHGVSVRWERWGRVFMCISLKEIINKMDLWQGVLSWCMWLLICFGLLQRNLIQNDLKASKSYCLLSVWLSRTQWIVIAVAEWGHDEIPSRQLILAFLGLGVSLIFALFILSLHRLPETVGQLICSQCPQPVEII